MNRKMILILAAICMLAGLTYAGTYQPDLDAETEESQTELAFELETEVGVETEVAACAPDADALDRALNRAFKVAMFDECLIACYEDFQVCTNSCGSNPACLSACASELRSCRISC